MKSVYYAHLRAWLYAAAFLVLVSQGTSAQQRPDTLVLRLEDARRLALADNPSLLAARQETAIALADRRQARTYPFNPELGALLPGVPRSGVALYELSLTQEIEWAGQRGLRSSAADHGVARAAAFVRDAARRTAGDASIAFYRAVAARSRHDLAQQAQSLSDRLIAAVRIQLREGEISSLEGNLAEIEAGRARGRVLGARREAIAAELELKQVIGLSPAVPIRLNVDTTITPPLVPLADSLIRVALARRPDMAAGVAATAQSRTLAALARREALPNIRAGAIVERDNPEDDQRVGLAVGIGIPLLNRNRGLIDRRRAETMQRELQTRAIELAVQTEVTNAVRAYETAMAEATVYETSVLGPARRNATLLDSAYRAGKLPLPTLLLLRNQLLDAELNYWTAWFALREALVLLDVATAAPSLDPTSPASPPARNRE